jgi:hypothetical protein
MPSTQHYHNGKHPSTENITKKNDDSKENEFQQQQQQKNQSLPPGKVYRVVRRPLKQSTQRIHELEQTVHRPEQDSLTFTGSKEKQDPPRATASADIRSAPSSSNWNTKSNVDTNSLHKPAAAMRRTIFTYKAWNGTQHRWNRTKTYKDQSNASASASSATAPHHFRIPLSRGGELNVFPNLIDSKKVNRVKKELLESKFWRKYSIQGGDEPRLHFLVRFAVGLFLSGWKPCHTGPSSSFSHAHLENDAHCFVIFMNQAHDDATDEFENTAQPGYRYANITMKARPLSSVPKLQQLSKDVADLRNIPNGKWNIGIHPVL